MAWDSFSEPVSGHYPRQDCLCVPRYPASDYSVTYDSNGTGSLDGRHFELMLLDGNAWRVRENLGETWVTNVDAWIQHWAHCDDRGMIPERWVSMRTDMPFIRYTEERVYQSRVGDYIARLFDAQVHPAYCIDWCKLKRPYDQLWWMAHPTSGRTTGGSRSSLRRIRMPACSAVGIM